MTKIISVHFTSAGVPVTGLSPTIDIYRLDPGPVNTLVISNGAATEVGLGWYRYDFSGYDLTKSYIFTFDGGISLADCDRYKVGGNESYEEDISSGVWDESAIAHTSAGTTGLMLNQIKADTASIVVSEAVLNSLLTLMLKFERNRTKIDVGAATLTVYDDDCTTVLWVFNLKDSSGFPSVVEVCERSPVGCP